MLHCVSLVDVKSGKYREVIGFTGCDVTCSPCNFDYALEDSISALMMERKKLCLRNMLLQIPLIRILANANNTEGH